MSDRIPARVLATLTSTVWAIEPEVLETLLDVVMREGEDLDALSAKLGRPLDNARSVTVREGVAVVPVVGPIVRYGSMFSRVSGLTSIADLATDLNAAAENGDVKSILLMLDTPGGEANGVNEAAKLVQRVRQAKPVTAYVGGTAASGGYWLGSAAERIVVDETARLGSIGVVYTVPVRRDDGAQVYEIVSTQSPRKRASPATAEGRAQIQAFVDRLAEEFVGTVARNRGVSTEHVLEQFGGGGILIGRDAIAAGMADEIGSFEELITQMAQGPRRGSNRPPARKARTMDWSTISVADLRANVPALVLEIEKAAATAATSAAKAEADARVATANETAAKAERERITGIHAVALPGQDALVANLVAEGASVGDAAVKLLSDAKGKGPAALASLAASTPSALPSEKPAGEKASPGTTMADARAVAGQIDAEMRKAADAGRPISYARAAVLVSQRAA